MAAAPGETAATYDALLTFGLLWLDHVAASTITHSRSAVFACFSRRGSGSVIAHRLKAVSASTIVELFEYDPAARRARRLDPKDAGNLKSWLMPRREIEAVMAQARPAIEPICRLNPAAISASRNLRNMRGCSAISRSSLCARGPQGTFLRNRFRAAAHPARQPELEAPRSRHSTPYAIARRRFTRHPLYRAQPERWLESLVVADAARIDRPHRSALSLCAGAGDLPPGIAAVMDLVGVTRDGRLAVMELKASEDVHLVMQAVDYWLRVRHHQEQQDFPRYGYFPGVTLDPRPPLLFLVAPSLQFHPAGDVLARYLIPNIEICRVGLNENWRRGLRVVLRQAVS